MLNKQDLRYIELLLQSDIRSMEYEQKMGNEDYKRSIVRCKEVLEKVRKM